MKKILILVLTLAAIVACTKNELSEAEIDKGLKEALKIGLDNSVATAAIKNGYLENESIRLELPPEVQELQNKINTESVTILDGALEIPLKKILEEYVQVNPNIEKDPFSELLVAMNRSAESAVSKAAPIFSEALLEMKIDSVHVILQGANTEATDYLHMKTNTELNRAFQPKMKLALDSTKAIQVYKSIADFVNYEYVGDHESTSYSIKVSDHIELTLPEEIETYSTGLAVDGILALVEKEEINIRANPMDYQSAIIQKVFSSEEAKKSGTHEPKNHHHPEDV